MRYSEIFGGDEEKQEVSAERNKTSSASPDLRAVKKEEPQVPCNITKQDLHKGSREGREKVGSGWKGSLVVSHLVTL